MCSTCGCGQGTTKFTAFNALHEAIRHPRAPVHAHVHHHDDKRIVQIERDILGKNNQYARTNREYFKQHGILALNLVSSPGSGKTSLLVATIKALKERRDIAVIEGDQQTSRDAERIRATGVSSLQINTGKACHLDAHMVAHALTQISITPESVLMIENVGNLVCPSAFDLGEAHKVVVLSVTEGEDKPVKYPDMFHAADVMILNKIDLLPYVQFDVQQCIAFAREVNPAIQVMQLSATQQTGMQAWLDWIEAEHDRVKACRNVNQSELGKDVEISL